MARFSICGGGGDDGEGSSNNHGSRKRQRLPSIDETEEESDAGSSGEEEDDVETQIHEEEEDNCGEGITLVSEDGGSTSDDSDRDMVRDKRRRFEKSVNSESSSPLSVTLLDPDVLDCPICCEPLKTPIFQCDNGHLACSVCCTKVRNRCPSCTLPIGYIRCRAMEKVIEASRVSCPNAKYGCKENMLYGNRFSHEKLCVFAPCSCPIRNCDYTGYYKDVNSHVRLKHKDDLISFSWDTSLSIRLDTDEKTTVIQEENDGEVIVVQVFKGLHVVYVTVSCIAPSSPEVGKLSCYLVNQTVDSLLKQGFMVKNIQKVGNVQPEDGFMVIPSYMLSGTFRVSIGREILLNVWHAISDLQDDVTIQRVDQQQLKLEIKLNSLLNDQEYVESLKAVMSSALDVMQAMRSSIWSSLSKVEEMNKIVSELVVLVTKESSMQGKCEEFWL